MITVLMPVYNGEKYLRTAIESVLNQTFNDFEFLIMNDGSSDSSKEIVLSYQDARIRFVENEQNMGLSQTLNKGLGLAKYDLIARMDCDDICDPTRFQKQFDFLANNSEYGICGSWIDVIGTGKVYSYPTTHENIKAKMLFNCMLAHPAVMLRKNLLVSHGIMYDSSFRYCQDYELWIRCLQAFKVANLPECLLHYREHELQMRSTFGDYVKQEPVKVKIAQIAYLVPNNKVGLDLHEQVLKGRFVFTKESYKELSDWLTLLEAENMKKNMYNFEIFSKYLYHIWFLAFIRIPSYSPASLYLILHDRFFSGLSFQQKVTFVLKCLCYKKNADVLGSF